MLDNRFRSVFEQRLVPVGSRVAASGVTANQVTLLGLILSGWAAFAIATGAFLAAVGLLVASAACDVVDGSIAKAEGLLTQRGAFLDSVADRLSDALVFGGLTWFYLSREAGSFVMVPVSVGFLALIVSYQRARAEGVGVSLRGGIMERAERIVLVCFALVFPDLMSWTLWVMLALLVATAIQRLGMVWKNTAP